MITKKVPEKKQPEEGILNGWSSKALRCLKQARRGEQILYRSAKMEEEAGEKKEAYRKLNTDAAKLMQKNLDKGMLWEKPKRCNTEGGEGWQGLHDGSARHAASFKQVP